MLEIINDRLWIIVTLLIIISGIYLSFKIKFKQFNLFKIKKYLSEKGSEDSINPFQTLLINLAARIGVGSITGVALAIYIGGVGTIFWMWLSGIFGSANTFVESILGVIYREKDEGKIFVSGPSYYIKKGLSNNFLATFFSIIMLFTFILGFMPIQSNTITKGIVDIVNIKPYVVGIVISVVISLVIFKGIKGIAKVVNYLVPFMGMIYFIVCLIILIKNIDLLPFAFLTIFKEAFNFKSAGVGIIIIGMQRGIFSNEAGIGTGAISAGVSDTNNPKSQGYIQSFGVLIDTLIFGTLSSLVVILSDYSLLNIMDPNGIEITKYVFQYHLGEFGSVMLLIVIILFAISSIITGYYYGEASLKFLKGNVKNIKLFKILTIIILFLGSVVSSTFLWALVDIAIGLLAIINIYAIIKLHKKDVDG